MLLTTQKEISGGVTGGNSEKKNIMILRRIIVKLKQGIPARMPLPRQSLI